MNNQDKIEKVIKGLECCIDDKCGVECPYCNDDGNCRLNMESDALALLKAQEARTVLFIFKASDGTFGNYPACDAELMDYYNKERCGRCGQAVKWE